MNDIERERVAREGDRNRGWTRMDADLNCGHRGRHTAHSAPQQDKTDSEGGVGRDAQHGGRDDRAPLRIGFQGIRVHPRFYAQLLDFSGSAYASR